ncbi:transcription termination/antitermination protein NusG [Sphingobium sp. TKS]|uniref:transcription termination/antitermination protein NusG n=1 Tax=Sphingobium sp. TKS TaxID=1315974 RepID=UPI0008373B5C|nr:transcription termination/antitermination NusG family protein [Sphingobium sp. TKS]
MMVTVQEFAVEEGLTTGMKLAGASSRRARGVLAAGARWYVAQTHPRSEQLGQSHLERQNFRCFIPRFQTTRRQARRSVTVMAPLFPGYIFVEFCPTRDRWQSINGTMGIKHLVGASQGRPTPMPASAMNAIFERCDGNEVKSLVPDLRVGDQIRITRGPFSDQLAAIESLDHSGRVRVLLDILGRATRVEVPLRSVGPA